MKMVTLKVKMKHFWNWQNYCPRNHKLIEPLHNLKSNTFTIPLDSCWKKKDLWVHSTDNFLSPIFFRISKAWSMLRHGLVRRVQSEECYCMFTFTNMTFFVVFHQKNVLLSFSFLFLIKYKIPATEY